MNACMHGWIEGCLYAWCDGWIGRTFALMDERNEGCLYAWMNVCLLVWIDNWMDVYMFGWMYLCLYGWMFVWLVGLEELLLLCWMGEMEGWMDGRLFCLYG